METQKKPSKMKKTILDIRMQMAHGRGCGYFLMCGFEPEYYLIH